LTNTLLTRPLITFAGKLLLAAVRTPRA
jgi:hypothetical protein